MVRCLPQVLHEPGCPCMGFGIPFHVQDKLLPRAATLNIGVLIVTTPEMERMVGKARSSAALDRTNGEASIGMPFRQVGKAAVAHRMTGKLQHLAHWRHRPRPTVPWPHTRQPHQRRAHRSRVLIQFVTNRTERAVEGHDGRSAIVRQLVPRDETFQRTGTGPPFRRLDCADAPVELPRPRLSQFGHGYRFGKVPECRD